MEKLWYACQSSVYSNCHPVVYNTKDGTILSSDTTEINYIPFVQVIRSLHSALGLSMPDYILYAVSIMYVRIITPYQ